MRKSHYFDPNAAFRNIVGVMDNVAPAEKITPEPPTVIISGFHEKTETRSKRVNLLLKPSVHEMAKIKCDQLNISLNECINQFLENWCRDI